MTIVGSIDPSTAPTRAFKPHFISAISLFIMVVLLSACNTVTVSKQSSAKTIAAQRGNIVTDDKLSSKTSSVLLSAGLNEQACFQYFDLCLTQIADSMLNQHYRSSLATYAELHYARARQLANNQDCRAALARPPINPYYANAPLSEDEAIAQQEKSENCLIRYQERLFDAVKFSYAYLFYDKLEHNFEGANSEQNSARMQNRIPNEVDIQTQDVYNAASNDVITQLYQTANNSFQAMGSTNIEYLPIENVDIITDNEASIANRAPLRGDSTKQVKVMAIKVDDYSLGVYLPNENNYLQNARNQTSALADLVSTYQLRLSGLNSISKRSGLGVPLVASLDERYTATIRQLLKSSLSGRLQASTSKGDADDSDPIDRIFPTGHLLVTGLITPTGTNVLDVLSSRQLDVHLYNPYQSKSATILGDAYPIAANFSAGYGMWLAENQLSGVGFLNLLTRNQSTTLPKLFMLEPYDPDKEVIIMLHGLASSPDTWVNLTNDIFNDDELRNNYQVWQIFYPTNLPILENRYQIQKLIAATYQQTDPSGQNRASNNSVIISHSMGAVIARMMLSNANLEDNLIALDDQNVLTASEKTKIANVLKESFGENKLDKRLRLHALPQVDTAVFLSAPFRGTDYADRWFTRALQRIIYLPVGLVKTVTDNLTTIATEGDLSKNPLGALYLQNGASQLSDKSSFIQLTKDIEITNGVTYHSIIANDDPDITEGLAQAQPDNAKIDLSQVQPDDNNVNDDNSSVSTITNDMSSANTPLVAAVTVEGDISQTITKRLSDGIVPYTSAHLEGAASETIINGGHSIQKNPQTILTLRRILHQHLQDTELK